MMPTSAPTPIVILSAGGTPPESKDLALAQRPHRTGGRRMTNDEQQLTTNH